MKPSRRKHKDKKSAGGADRSEHSDKERLGSKEVLWRLLLCVIAIGFGVMHRNHLSFMFESDRHFSHLSDLEREMTFRTEMGLYFSYYKSIVHAPSLAAGMHSITHDNVTEHGHTINTLKRFNLYPEVLIGFLYRTYKQMADSYKWKTEVCYETSRGENLSPILSCEGNGNAYYFYVNAAFIFGGIVATLLFAYGVVISDSFFGGLIAFASFFFNHGEATRIQWTPPLRETFGYPVFLAQMLFVSYMIKHRMSGLQCTMLVAGLTMNFMCFWQFAPFSLSTQVGALFVCFVFGYIPPQTMTSIALGHLAGFVGAFVLLFGNEMLVTSLFLSSVLSVLAIIVFEGMFSWLNFTFLIRAVQLIVFTAGVLGIKIGIAQLTNIKDDAHIFDILRAKFTDFSTFDTRLYTCAAEFDFQPLETYTKLSMTLLLPAAGVITLIYLAVIAYDQLSCMTSFRCGTNTNFDRGIVAYNVVQMLAYALMSFLIMRLKLFWTPHLCILAAMVASPKLCYALFTGRVRPLYQQAFCVALIAAMAVQGVSNLNHQWGILGEYSNPDLEQLIEWINKTTKIDDPFAGTMPTMANLKLSTHRPIAMHPHYEDVGLRHRVMMSYSVFSRKPPKDVHEIIKALKVNYYVFEYQWCMKNPAKEECSILGSWDIIDPDNRGQKPFCERVKDNDDLTPFQVVFTNQHYTVLKVV